MDYKDYIANNKKNGHFWHEARKVLIYKLISLAFQKSGKNQKNILDIGCGTGDELDILSGFGRLTAMDKNNKALDLVREKGFVPMLADIEKDRLPEEKYDLVSAFDVLEHLDRDRAALENIYRSLKKDSYFIFSVPAHRVIFSQHDIALEHKRRYSKKELSEKLSAEGFKDIELYYWNFSLFPLVAILRLAKKIFLKKTKLGSEAKNRGKFLDYILFKILRAEAKYCFGKKTPPGLSIYGLAKK